MKRLSDEQLAELEALEKLITPERWSLYSEEGHNSKGFRYSVCHNDFGLDEHECLAEGYGKTEDEVFQRAKFIVESRNHLHALLAELRQFREARKRVKELRDSSNKRVSDSQEGSIAWGVNSGSLAALDAALDLLPHEEEM